MEKDGLIMRTVFPEIPPRVEYSLAEMGLSIFKVFIELRRWGLEDDKAHQAYCSFCGRYQPFILNDQQMAKTKDEQLQGKEIP